MNYRTLGKTKYKVSEIGYGSWSLGGDWGDVSNAQAVETLKSVVHSGINFIDTADVYGDGRSESIIGEFKQNTQSEVLIATKAGRRVRPHVATGYTREHIHEFVSRSIENLRIPTLDLLQLHCPPPEVYDMPEVFEILDELVTKKMIRFYGVSVEKVEEAQKAISYPNVATVQIIFNMFRQRPVEQFFAEAIQKNIGIIVRVPLASGLLSGKMNQQTQFPQNDHRQFNRHGEAFDVGETFAGVDFTTGLSAVEALRNIKPQEYTMSQFALKWILMQPAVSTVIAGAKNPSYVAENAHTSDLPPLSVETMQQVEDIYTQTIKPLVHTRW
jgi:aryl-alcohol dehydrogenase-like predicted oxidoreductase